MLIPAYHSHRFGFIYCGFREEYWLWQYALVARQLAVVFVTVFMPASLVPVGLCLCLFIAFWIQVAVRPYSRPLTNSLEAIGLALHVLTQVPTALQ